MIEVICYLQSDLFFLSLVETTERKRMNSFMSWVGGKKSLRDAVLARFPPYYERYIEVFGGAGWVLFHKPPGNDFEVYNGATRS